MSVTFPKSERLTGKKDIARLFSDGQTLFSHPFKVLYMENSMETNRFMVSVPKRNFKKAVTRNLLKRRIRESFRLNKELLEDKNYDLAFIYIAKEVLNYSNIDKKLLELLHRLK